jgi:hypothetical protein
MHERAELDREARLHQAEIQRVADEQKRQAEAKELASALHGELIAAAYKYSATMSWLRVYSATVDGIAKTPGGTVPAPVKVPRTPTPVYDANVAKVGLLGASLAAAQAYGILQAELEWTQPPHISAKLLAPVLKGCVDAMPDNVSDILHVGGRLAAFQYGSEDPGLLVLERKRRKEEQNTKTDAPDHSSSGGGWPH